MHSKPPTARYIEMGKKTVFITGSTGVMGYETLREFYKRLDRFNIRLLVRPSKKNRRKLRKFLSHPNIKVVWGDMLNLEDMKRAIGKADYVLHIGGMVSPAADHCPEKTLEVNIGAMRNVIKAVKDLPDPDSVKVVYIGSVAQTSNYNPPYHWGRIGDPIMAAKFDYYGLSKIIAERLLSESGLKHWVSLRQTGILHPGLIFKASDPISFHVPLNGVLEWVSVEDSARLMANLCDNNELPDYFWRGYYNIGGGKEFRLTNYQFEKLLMGALGCPAPEKCFDRNWFATSNFHGEWYEDSDLLNDIIPFREEITAEEYFKSLARKMPWWGRLAPLAPAPLVKLMMKQVAKDKTLGTLGWLRSDDNEEKIKAFFGSRELQSKIGGWDEFDSTPPANNPIRLHHGFDDSKPDDQISIDDVSKAADFRGGKLISTGMDQEGLDKPLEWECGEGHRFKLTARTVLRGGHWCPECLERHIDGIWDYEKLAQKNSFLRQKIREF